MNYAVISIAKEPILTFGIILLITLLVPILFQRLKLPGIVGLLIAGSVVGQNGLGFIEAAGVIDVLGKVGLLYLMFLAGLEISLDQLVRDRSKIVVFGSLTFLIPQLLGTAVFLWLGYGWAAAILIASMFASHTPVGYPIITRLGLTREPSVSTAIGGTILTDTAALLVLAVVARTVEGNMGVSFWLTFVTLFAAYLVAIFVILPRLSLIFFRSIGEMGRFTYVYVIGTMLMAAWLAEYIGIEAIVGAFFAGLAFNRLLSNKGPLKNRIEFFGDAFFIPLFLIYVGMLVDFKVLLSNVDVWIVMAAMVATVVATKWLAAFLSGKILRFTSDQVWVIFGLTNTQAAATLAAVFVGLQLGIFGSEVLNGAIMMILVTCIIGPIVVEKYGLRLADDVTRELEQEPAIAQRVLVPLANPQTSARLIEFASNLKSRDLLTIYPLSVLDTLSDFQSRRERATKLLDLAVGQIHAVNCAASPQLETNLNIAEGISMSVVKHDITDIVIGWNGEVSASTRIFGSILDQMLATTQQKTYVCKLDHPISTFRRIMLVIPPKTAVSPTFQGLLGSLINLISNLNVKLELYHLSVDHAIINRALILCNNHLQVHFRDFSTFDQLVEELLAETTPNDLPLVVAQRNFDAGWAQGVNLLPRMLARQLPDSSFVVAYLENPESSEFKIDLLYTN
jgi:Kef-type K+ transport system membrane component KefB